MFDIDFAKTFYYPGGGTDIQPLLRFSHLTDTILAPTVSRFLTREKMKELFSAKCSVLNRHFEENLLELVDVIDMDHVFDNEPLYVSGAQDIFSRHEAMEYMNAFSDKIPDRLSATGFVFRRRIGKTERIMNWIHATSEGLAMLFRMHELTGQVPEIVCTIQTGILEYPNGPFMRMFEHLGAYPQFWIRGYWPLMDWERTPITSFSPYEHIAQDYGHWSGSMRIRTIEGEDNPADLPQNAVSYVRGYSRSPLQAGPQSKTICSSRNPDRQITLIHDSILEHLHEHDRFIISEHVMHSNPQISQTNIATWESLSRRLNRQFPPFTFVSSLKVAERHFSIRGTERIAMLPTGYEDESMALEEFLESATAPLDLTIYMQRSYDFIDIMRTLQHKHTDENKNRENHEMQPLEEQEKIEYYRKIYRALHVLGKMMPGAAVPAVAGMRLLLMDAIGQEAQRELIGVWNEELEATAYDN